MIVQRRKIPGLAITSYLVADEKTRKAAVIDPVRDVDEYLDIAEKNKVSITDILETHVHADFVSGSKELKHRLNGKATIHCSGLGGEEWTPKYADRILHNGDEVVLGDLRLRAVHSPGHTPEHIMWELYDDSRSKETPCMLFTGDFLFVGDVGRPDLLGKDAKKTLLPQLYHSVFDLMPKYPDHVEIFPSHGSGSLCGKAIGSKESSTMGYERLFNPSLQKMAEAEWGERLMRQMPHSPSYFKRMKRTNVEGPAILGDLESRLNAYTPSDVLAMDPARTLILDTRSIEAFSALHIKGSICMPYQTNISTYAGSLLPYDRPIVLIVEKQWHISHVFKQLIRVGLDNIEGYMDGGSQDWEEAGLELVGIKTLSIETLHEKLKDPADLLVVDVRTIGEWSEGHIPNAWHIPISVLDEKIDALPNDRSLALICRSGSRSTIAVSLLEQQGRTNIFNVIGGMEAWEKEQFQTTME